jgi:carbon storage regulator
MLVLSRRESQSIVIGKDVVVTVVSIRGDQVRIGIDAPRSITVHRKEVAVAIETANREAAAAADIDPLSLPAPLPRPPGSGGAKAPSGGAAPSKAPSKGSEGVSSQRRGTTRHPGHGTARPAGSAPRRDPGRNR